MSRVKLYFKNEKIESYKLQDTKAEYYIEVSILEDNNAKWGLII